MACASMLGVTCDMCIDAVLCMHVWIDVSMHAVSVLVSEDMVQCSVHVLFQTCSMSAACDMMVTHACMIGREEANMVYSRFRRRMNGVIVAGT